MTGRAMRLVALSPIADQIMFFEVITPWHHLDVPRVDAPRVFAPMVCYGVLWDGAAQKLIDHAVSVDAAGHRPAIVFATAA